jgi:hypothetical protein
MSGTTIIVLIHHHHELSDLVSMNCFNNKSHYGELAHEFFPPYSITEKKKEKINKTN